jgi:hypothetical protein
MNKIIVALLLLCAGYWSALNQAKLKSWLESVGLYDPPKKESTEEKADLLTQADPFPVVQKPVQAPIAPAPAALSTPPIVVPSQPSPLEDGVYYTKQRVSQMIDQGVVVIPERTEVRVVGELNGQLIVEADGKRILVSRNKLTNDPAEVRALLEVSKVPTVIPAEKKISPKVSSASLANAEARSLREANATKRRVIWAKIAELDRRITTANYQVNDLRSQSQAAKYNGRPSTYNDRPIAALQAQISAMEAERSRLTIESAAISDAPR